MRYSVSLLSLIDAITIIPAVVVYIMAEAGTQMQSLNFLRVLRCGGAAAVAREFVVAVVVGGGSGGGGGASGGGASGGGASGGGGTHQQLVGGLMSATCMHAHPCIYSYCHVAPPATSHERRCTGRLQDNACCPCVVAHL